MKKRICRGLFSIGKNPPFSSHFCHRPQVLLISFLWFLFPLQNRAADIVSAQSGSWTSSSTWTGGVVPSQTDNVTVKSGHSVTIPSSGTKTCCNLTVESGGHLYANAGGAPRYLDIYGNIACDGVIGNGSTYDAISFNTEASACLISGSGSFDASRLRKNTGTNSNATLTFGMNVNLRYGGTALFNNKSATNFHIIINPGVILTCPGNGGVNGNVCIDGSNASNGSSYGGSVTVNGTLTISGILYLTTDNNSSTYTVSFTVNSGGVVNTGSVVCTNSGSAGHTINLNDGSLLNFTSGDWGTIGLINNTYIFSTASTIEYSGTGSQNVGNPSAYGALIVCGQGEKNISPGNLTVCSDLTVNDHVKLIVPDSLCLTVQGNTILNDTNCLVLKAGTSTTAAGSFICNGSVSGAGSARIEKFMSKYLSIGDPIYHEISSPVSSQRIQTEFVSDPPDDSTDFYRWDEPSGMWINSKNLQGQWNTGFQEGDNRNFKAGTGYLAAYPADVIKNFSGMLNTSDQNVPVSYTSGTYAGYNLTGNPFSSALNGNIQSWTKSNMDNAIWVWDPSAGNYKTWNGTAGTLLGGVIPAMQGFFVKASGSSPSLVIPGSSRVHHAHPGYKNTLQNLLGIYLFGGNFQDGVYLHLPSNGAGESDTAFNVRKFFGFAGAPQLYIITDSSLFSVFRTDTSEHSGVIRLGIHKGAADTLQFKFTGTESFNGNETLSMEDRTEGITINLLEESSYEFVSCDPVENDRFFLHYSKTTGINPHLPSGKNLIFSDGRDIGIYIPWSSARNTIHVYDQWGRQVLEKDCQDGLSIIRPGLVPGCYVVLLETEKNRSSQSIVLFK